MKQAYIAKGVVKKLTPEQGKLFKDFSLDRWLMEKLRLWGVNFFNECCIEGSTLNSSQTLETLDANSPISLNVPISYLATTAARAYTLADGVLGQEKIIKMTTDGGDGVITVAHLLGGTTITFNDVNDTVKLQFIGTQWTPIYNSGAVIS